MCTRNFPQSLVVAIFLFAFHCNRASATEQEITAPRFEVYLGGDYLGRSASLYSTSIWSVAGPVTQPGFRLRASGLANFSGETNANVFSNGFLPANANVLGDLMAGYQYNQGSLWVKFYAGMAFQGQTRFLWDAAQQSIQQNWGPKTAIETWWRPTNRLWLSVNLSWLKPNDETGLNSRAAYEFTCLKGAASLSLGGEMGATRANANIFKEEKRLDQYNDYFRAGPFLSLRYGMHEFTVSGGFAEDSYSMARRPYATLSYGKKF
jgi:hypothetical protein